MLKDMLIYIHTEVMVQFFCETSFAFLFHSAFARLVQGWLKPSNHICLFFVILSSRIMPAFDFSESFSSRFSAFTSLFRHTSLLRVSNIISRNLIILASSFESVSNSSGLSLPLKTGLSGTKSALRVEWRLVTLLPTPSLSQWVENLSWLYNFLDAYAILVITLPFAIHEIFLPCFVYLKTLAHILLCHHVTYAAC